MISLNLQFLIRKVNKVYQVSAPQNAKWSSTHWINAAEQENIKTEKWILFLYPTKKKSPCRVSALVRIEVRGKISAVN